MESISPDDLALELLNQCLRGNAHSAELLESLVGMALSEDPTQARRASRALFSIVVERLADLFEPCLCDAYALLFSDVIGRVVPGMDAGEILRRHRRIRDCQPYGNGATVRDVFVLSRVTLGADVAVTSVLLDAAKRRFPDSNIWFTGPRKNWELFARDSRLRHAGIDYPRDATLRDRLAIHRQLSELLAAPDSIVIDPDSRLTQLGLLPVGDEDRYYFFESRSYGEYSDQALPELARRWAAEIFGVESAAAFIAPLESAPHAMVTVSLGVGDNQSKRVAGPFERGLMEELASSGASVLVDRGGSEEEASRVDRAIGGLPNVRTWTGAFAPFASAIAMSALYCGYDSAGQHVAAACGTPLVSVFAGYASPRMFYRWRPYGTGLSEVIRADGLEAAAVLEQAKQAVRRLRRV